MRTTRFAIGSLLATMTWSAAAQNLVVNGGFELPVVVNAASYAPGDNTNIPGWTVDATPPDGVQLGAPGVFGPNNGSQILQLTGGAGYAAGGGVSQTITTIPGMVYTISIDVASRSGAAVSGQMNFGGDDTTLTASSESFSTLSWTAIASGSSTLIDLTGSTNSASAQLIVDNVEVATSPGGGTRPGITAQPLNATAFVTNGNAIFSVTASGTEPLSYQWYFNTNTPLPNATNNTLTISNPQITNAGRYSVIVTNNFGSATSSAATLTLLAQASNLVVNPGFEEPIVQGYVLYPPGDNTDIPSWTVDATPPDGVQLGAAGVFGPDNGSQNLQLTGSAAYSGGGGVSQTIPTKPGMVYTISIGVASASAFGSAPAGAVAGEFNFGGNYTALSTSSENFTTLFWQVTAAGSSTLIDITGYTNSASDQIIIDNVYVAATPGAGSPPGITTQPGNAVNVIDTSASFSVAASGLQPLSYQWYFNTNSLLPGATNNTLTIGNVQPTNAGGYSVVISNSLGSITSSVAALALVLDTNGDFQEPVIAYYESFDPGSTNIPGWTVDTTPPDGVQIGVAGLFAANNGSPGLQLTGAANYATGGGISQTISTAPGMVYTISIDVASRGGKPVTGNFNFGGNNTPLTASSQTFKTLSWTAIASGSNTLMDITGSTNSGSVQLVINNVEAVATPGAGVKPGILAQPGNATNFLDASASFSVAASGTEPLSYQWYFKTNTPAGSGATLTLNNIQPANAGNYFVIITNEFGSITSSVATLTVRLGPPIFSSTNEMVTSYAGGNLSFNPLVYGALPFTYQWYFKGQGQKTSAPLPGATNSSLAFFPLETAQSGQYSLVVTNSFGATTGAVAALTVLPNQTLNWGFELPNVPLAFGGAAFASLAGGDTNLTDWIIDTNPPDGVQLGVASIFGADDGTQVIQLTGGTSYGPGGGISQTILTTPGQVYMVSVDVASRESRTVDGEFDFGTNAYPLEADTGVFTTVSWPVVATGASTLINVVGSPNSPNVQLLIDNVLVIPLNPTINIQSDGTNIILSWPFGTVQAANTVSGPYTNVVGVISPWTNAPPLAPEQFYRLVWSP